ncbi:MAG: 4Fe-4S binding protein [Oscillospiraceae bacterium]|nr:4Fe-4S binding protein [Oscillospiraceae bacterium]
MAKVIFNESRCKGCELCISVCPKKLLKQAEKINVLGFKPVEIVEPDKCIGCASCAVICPDAVITVEA